MEQRIVHIARLGGYPAYTAIGTPAAFAPDGESVVIAENGGRVRTWDLDPAVWIERACRMAGRNLTEQEWREYLPGRDYVAACSADS